MGEGSPDDYLKRKKHILRDPEPRPRMETDSISSHFRPHVTVPELREYYPNVYVPPEPSSSSSSGTGVQPDG